ncbi:polysaccharide deacetylase family protein [Chitinophagaceae bacterium LWZ2-11]
MYKIVLIGFLVCAVVVSVSAQQPVWNNKEAAVVLTYDDAVEIDLDNVIPVLDSLNLKGTFYLIGSASVIDERMDEWRNAAKHGHELGNHTLFHPCNGTLPGRGFVTAETDLSKYTVQRAVNEIRATNTLLKAIDGKNYRTFAYPCGDVTIGDSLYLSSLWKEFAAVRGVHTGMQTIDKVDLHNVYCYGINGESADRMIELVKQAVKTRSLLVFLFHGVGGGHSINVSLEAHSKLLHYLKDHEKEIWVAPMVDVAEYIKTR